MEGLRELVCLDPTRSNPAVGILYGRNQWGKLLIIGESHYGGESWAQPDATHNRIQALIDGRRCTYFTKLAHLFDKEVAEFYSRVAFYNFKSLSLDCPGQRVSPEGFKGDADQRYLFRVIDELLPDYVVVTSVRLWHVLPTQHPDAPENVWRVTDDCSDLFVSFARPEESEEEKRRSKECFWYRRADGDCCLVGAIPHPRSAKFNKGLARWMKGFIARGKTKPAVLPPDA